MVKCSFIILLSVQLRPDRSLLFLLEWHTSTEIFLVTSWLPETGERNKSLLHHSCAWRNSIPALGLGLVGTGDEVLGAWKEKGGEMHITPI